jgi:hypothetical protein
MISPHSNADLKHVFAAPFGESREIAEVPLKAISLLHLRFVKCPFPGSYCIHLTATLFVPKIPYGIFKL